MAEGPRDLLTAHSARDEPLLLVDGREVVPSDQLYPTRQILLTQNIVVEVCQPLPAFFSDQIRNPTKGRETVVMITVLPGEREIINESGNSVSSSKLKQTNCIVFVINPSEIWRAASFSAFEARQLVKTLYPRQPLASQPPVTPGPFGS